MTDALRVRNHNEVHVNADATVNAGEIQQMRDGRAGYKSGFGQSLVNDPIIFITEGVVKVNKTTGVVFLDGGRVYWDFSANLAHYFPNSDRDFFIGVAVGDAASADTTMLVALNVKPAYLITQHRDEFRNVTVLTAGAPTNNAIGGSQYMTLDTTNEAQKVDMLSDRSWAVGAKAIIEGKCVVINNGNAGNGALNIGLASGTNATNADNIAEAVFIHLDTNSTKINAESRDGTTTVAKTDTTLTFTVGTAFEFWIDARNLANVKIYVNGAQVLSGTTFRLDNAAGPHKLLAHVAKTANATPASYAIDFLRARIADQ